MPTPAPFVSDTVIGAAEGLNAQLDGRGTASDIAKIARNIAMGKPPLSDDLRKKIMKQPPGDGDFTREAIRTELQNISVGLGEIQPQSIGGVAPSTSAAEAFSSPTVAAADAPNKYGARTATREEAQMGFDSSKPIIERGGFVLGTAQPNKSPNDHPDYHTEKGQKAGITCPMVTAANGEPFNKEQIAFIRQKFGQKVTASEDGKVVYLPASVGSDNIGARFSQITDQLGIKADNPGIYQKHSMESQAAAPRAKEQPDPRAQFANWAANVDPKTVQAAPYVPPVLEQPSNPNHQSEGHAARVQAAHSSAPNGHALSGSNPDYLTNPVIIRNDNGQIIAQSRGGFTAPPRAPDVNEQRQAAQYNLTPALGEAAPDAMAPQLNSRSGALAGHAQASAPAHTEIGIHAPKPRFDPLSHAVAAPAQAHGTAHHTLSDAEIMNAVKAALSKCTVAEIKVFQTAGVRAGEDLGNTGKGHNGVDGDGGKKTAEFIFKMCKESGININELRLAGPANDTSKVLVAHIGGKVLENEMQIARTIERAQKHMAETSAHGPSVELGAMCATDTPNCKVGGPARAVASAAR